MLTQSEEHNQLFCQPSIEFLVRLIHFVHFIHPCMNPSPGFFHDLEELRYEPVSLPFEERIKVTNLGKSFLYILAVLLNIPLKT